MKHEHFHYHYPTKDSHFSGSHPQAADLMTTQDLTPVADFLTPHDPNRRTGIITGHGQYQIYSKPIDLQLENSEKYKNQYKGQPYKKRAEDKAYFPTGDNVSLNIQTQELSDKNNRNLE